MTCRPISVPSNQELKEARRSILSKSRALLVFLGEDPTPANVERVTFTGDSNFTINGRNFEVLDNEEVLDKLEIQILSMPKLIPPKFLALFFLGAFPMDMDFRVLEIIAASLIHDSSMDSKWAINKLTERDKQVRSHLEELIIHTGLRPLLEIPGSGITMGQTTFHGNNYIILEYPVKSTLEDNQC